MKLLFSQALVDPHNINKIIVQKLNKLTQQKETIGQHIPKGGALSPLAYTAKKDYNGELLICNKFFIPEFSSQLH
jgi:hypothetical protein